MTIKRRLTSFLELSFFHRYSWYLTRTNVSDTSWVSNSANLFELDSSTLNALGQYYNDFTYNSTMPPTTTSAPTTTGSANGTTTTEKTESGARKNVLFSNTVALFCVLPLLMLRFGL